MRVLDRINQIKLQFENSPQSLTSDIGLLLRAFEVMKHVAATPNMFSVSREQETKAIEDEFERRMGLIS